MQNRKLLLKMTISNLEKTWTNTAMFEFSLAKPDIRQLPWQKLKFSNDFLFLVSPSPSSRPFYRMGKNKLKWCTSHLYFIFSIILKSTQLCPVSQHDLRWSEVLIWGGSNTWENPGTSKTKAEKRIISLGKPRAMDKMYSFYDLLNWRCE